MTGHEENLDRAYWQSARTKDGEVAELPLPYHLAWDAAHEEERRRSSGQWTCANCGKVNPTFDPWCAGCEEPQP